MALAGRRRWALLACGFTMIECHFHPTDEPLCHDLEGVLARARGVGVQGFVATGYDPASNAQVSALAQAESDVVAAVGYHPWFLARAGTLDDLALQAQAPRVVALGEMGLDGKVATDRALQERWFVEQLGLARDLHLPVVVHSRAAFDRTLHCTMQVPGSRGILHSFGGSPEMAMEFIKRGFVISFSGTVTRSRAKRVHCLARALPLAAMVIETDAPAIGAHGVEPGAIEPRHLPLVVNALAALRGELPEIVAAATSANARALLDW
jgi:TatD DNase family protein